MKSVAATLAFLLAALAVWAYSYVWETDHVASGPPAVSPDGRYVAQMHHLSEGTEKPYGQGVYVRHRLVPAWLKSITVFAGYCEVGEHVAWSKGGELLIYCQSSQNDQPVFYPPPGDINVIHATGRS